MYRYKDKRGEDAAVCRPTTRYEDVRGGNGRRQNGVLGRLYTCIYKYTYTVMREVFGGGGSLGRGQRESEGEGT